MSKVIQNLSAILAMDDKGGIGLDNTLAWKIPEDLKWFKEHTLNKTILMGSNTLASILSYSKGKLLPNRHHCVLSRNMQQVIEGVDYYRNIDTFLDCVKANPEKEFMVIGGAQVYEQMFPYINQLYLTRVKGDFKCDTFLDLSNYSLDTAKLNIEVPKTDMNNGLDYSFYIYKHLEPKPKLKL